MITKITNSIFIIIASVILFGCKTKYDTKESVKVSAVDVKIQNSDSLRQIIFKGISAEISIERVIYNFFDQKNYYVKFVIKNISNKKIGVDLTNSIKQFYPNHYCFYCSNSEGVKEGRTIQSNNDYDQLKNDFKNGRLTIINAKEEFHYYRNICNYDDEKINFDKIKRPEDFFRIRLDGQLVVTNGNEVEEYRLDDKTVDKRLVIFTIPILNKEIPNTEKQFVYKVLDVRPQPD
ncbi:hypothetical protein [Flavobacterium gyeonganense]|uniref:Lipoprotein n=1 Tax=Flavobacterium gyeonganense TaxID=1310418 RepID=A0ABV5HF49_9FLAO|nr:hypothetical protein [Flavobacterium gyeonganense]